MERDRQIARPTKYRPVHVAIAFATMVGLVGARVADRLLRDDSEENPNTPRISNTYNYRPDLADYLQRQLLTSQEAQKFETFMTKDGEKMIRRGFPREAIFSGGRMGLTYVMRHQSEREGTNFYNTNFAAEYTTIPYTSVDGKFYWVHLTAAHPLVEETINNPEQNLFRRSNPRDKSISVTRQKIESINIRGYKIYSFGVAYDGEHNNTDMLQPDIGVVVVADSDMPAKLRSQLLNGRKYINFDQILFENVMDGSRYFATCGPDNVKPQKIMLNGGRREIYDVYNHTKRMFIRPYLTYLGCSGSGIFMRSQKDGKVYFVGIAVQIFPGYDGSIVYPMYHYGREGLINLIEKAVEDQKNPKN